MILRRDAPPQSSHSVLHSPLSIHSFLCLFILPVVLSAATSPLPPSLFDVRSFHVQDFMSSRLTSMPGVRPSNKQRCCPIERCFRIAKEFQHHGARTVSSQVAIGGDVGLADASTQAIDHICNSKTILEWRQLSWRHGSWHPAELLHNFGVLGCRMP